MKRTSLRLPLALAAALLTVTAHAATPLPVQRSAAAFFKAQWGAKWHVYGRVVGGRPTDAKGRHPAPRAPYAISEACSWQGTTSYQCTFEVNPLFNDRMEGDTYTVTRASRCVYAIDEKRFDWGVALVSGDTTTFYHACFR